MNLVAILPVEIMPHLNTRACCEAMPLGSVCEVDVETQDVGPVSMSPNQYSGANKITMNRLRDGNPLEYR